MRIKAFLLIIFIQHNLNANIQIENSELSPGIFPIQSHLKTININAHVRKLLGFEKTKGTMMMDLSLSETLPQVTIPTVLEDNNLGDLEPSVLFNKIINRFQKLLITPLQLSFIQYFAEKFGYEMTQEDPKPDPALKSAVLTVPGFINTPALPTQSSPTAAAVSSSPTSTSRDSITLYLPNGTKQEIFSGFDSTAYSKAFGFLRSGALAKLEQKTETQQEVRSLTISNSDYQIFLNSQFRLFTSAPSIQLQHSNNFNRETTFPVTMDSPAFAHKDRSYQILGTAGVCDCVVIVGYNTKTTQTFMIHASWKFDPNLLQVLIPKLKAEDDRFLKFYLVTRQLAVHSEKILEVIKKTAPSSEIFVSFFPGILQETERLNDGRLQRKQIVDPKLIDFTKMTETFSNPNGISVFFHSSTGNIHY